jgi:CRP/FNR family transcriptional regulator, cyclic AMP receptor protein
MSWDDLRRVPLFATLPAARLREIAVRCPAHQVQPGTVLARHADPAKNLIILVRGQLTAVHSGAAGERVRLPLIAGPCVVDKATVLSGANHAVTWTARTECTVRLMDRSLFQDLMNAEPGMRNHALSYLASQVMGTRWERIRRDTLNPTARIASWLLEHGAAGQTMVPLTAGQQGLAEELGLSRVTVNRVLQALKRSGAVRVRRSAVEILNADALAATAGPETAG